ncbi:MFS transporter [Humibacter sp. RRB41]|uniref:MFS transporter n=1 Tax=Humibacter sp. RRB41 TaxID=2919946 RepID=UPI001FAA221C|nr:MFS transporter [Humibacter sp. RRB41]
MTTALRSPVFARVLGAGLVSDTGDWMLFVALPLVVYRFTGSAIGTSLAFVLELLPAVLLAPVAARLIARFDRRRLLIGISLVQAVAVAPLFFVRSAAELPVLYVVIVLQASCAAVFEPAKDSWLPELVAPDRLVSANALVGLAQNIGRLVGGPLGGALLAFGRLDLVVAVDIVSFLGAAALLWSAPRTGIVPLPTRAATDDPVATGVLAALRDRKLRALFVSVALAGAAQGLFLVLFVLFVTDSLNGSDAAVGLLRGIQAIGSIAAGAALGFLAITARPKRLLIIGALAFGIVSLLVWNLPFLTTALWPYVILFIVVGAPGVLLTTGYISIIQTTASDRGASFAAFGLVNAVGQGIGLLAAGLLQPVTGLLPLLETQGCLYLLSGLVMLGPGSFSRRYRGGRPATLSDSVVAVRRDDEGIRPQARHDVGETT